MRRLITLLLLKFRSWYWVGSCVIDRTGGTKYPGMVLAVGDLNAHILPQVDAGGDPRVVPMAWDRLFPGWRTSVVLMIFFPRYARALTKVQFVKSLEDMDRLKDLTPEQIQEHYDRIPPRRTVWVPSIVMKRIPYSMFMEYWRAHGNELQAI